MEKLILSICAVGLSALTIFAQVPEKMNYQGVLRDISGNIMANRDIKLQIILHSGSSNGPEVYKETQPAYTNQFGLFNVQIGAGTIQSGTFSSIDWGGNSYYAEVLVNINGGPSFTSMGIQQLISVPYALYAKSSGSNSANGALNYVAKFTPNGTSLGNSIIYDNGTNVGIGISNPDDKLDVAGNSQVAGYLKVGNPSVPTNSISKTPIPLYKLSYLSGTEAWSVDNPCGDHSKDQWYVDISSTNSGLLFYGSQGQYNRSNVYSPWIWVPTGTSNLTVEATYYCDLEDNYDGVFLEYITNGGSWSKISSFNYGGYPDYADGCNTSCRGKDPQLCWNGINDTKFFRVDSTVFHTNVYGNWIRFRFVGMEDGGTGSGSFGLHGFNVTAFGGTSVGGPFAQGNIYAEKNIYAGANVLLGDVAEYFNVDVETEPGDLIAISRVKNDSYTKSESAYNSYILGIHSTNPTVTLNTPSGTPVCLTGRVPVKVCGENGIIKIGDYLTSASLPGYAMKADKPCFIIGRALENFDGLAISKILCIVETGWYNPSINSNKNSGGSFFVSKGNNSVTVNDHAIKSDSRIFATLRDNAGYYWVSNISNGMFTINLEKTSQKNIPFDYFVDNANLAEVKEDKVNNYLVKEEKKIKIPSNNQNFQKIQLKEYSDATPPNSPPDPKIPWTWLKNTGFVKTVDQQK